MAETSLDAFKAKDTRFVADWLKSLHKLCSVFEGIQEPFVLSSAWKSVVYYTIASSRRSVSKAQRRKQSRHRHKHKLKHKKANPIKLNIAENISGYIKV